VITETRHASAIAVRAPSRLLAGSSALLVVDVTAPGPVPGAVTGAVRVQLDSPLEHGAVLAEGELDPDGRAMLTVVLPLGEHVLRVVYAGDAACAPSSCARVLRVAAHPTLVTVAGSRGPVPSGETVVLTAQVSSSEESRAPSGTVLFLDGGRELGSARLGADGAAVLPVAALGTGVHRIVAAYSGDASHAASRSTPIPQAVAVAVTPTRLVLEQAEDGSDVTVTVTVTAASTGHLLPAATGEVVLRLAGTAAPLRLVLVDGSARVRLPVASGAVLGADYTGDAEHAPCAIGS
jgi:Bacterial Ig-like domain (group 3)